MATLFGQPMDIGSDKHSIVDDFMYGSNVASSHVYIRLGILLWFVCSYTTCWFMTTISIIDNERFYTIISIG